MLKTILAVLVAAIIALASGGSAFASTTAFADLELVRIYYDRNGDEIATALGKVTDVTASGSPFAGSFGSLTAEGDTWAVYFSVDRTNNKIWATGATGTASIINGALSSMNSMKTVAGIVLQQCNNYGTGNSYTGSASAINSYRNKLSSTQGYLGNAITSGTRLNTEADLGPLLLGEVSELKQILYHWSKGVTAVADEKVGIPVAYITTKANGSTVISPPPPSAPTGVSATAGDAQATVSFVAPVSPGGSAVTGYIVTSEPDGKTATGPASPITVTGLTNGTSYKFTVAAINDYGTGPFNPNGKSTSVTPTAAAATYTVNATVNGGHGTIAPAGNTSVAQGGSLTLTISSDANYHLSALTDNGSDVIGSVVDGTYTITGVAADHTVIATFAIDTYSVTASVTGGNGTLTPASSTVEHGGNVTLTVTPASNYHLATLTDNGSDVIGSVVDGTYTITGVAADHTVSATYAIDTHSITASVAGGNGTLTPASSTVEHGGNVIFTVTPAPNYHLATLTDNGTDVIGNTVDGTYAITVAADHAVVATFAINTWTVTTEVTGNGALTTASSTVNHGDNVTLAIAPAENHHLSALTDNGNNVDITDLVNGGSYTITGVVANHTVVATFAIKGHTVTPSVGVGTGHGSITADTPQAVDHGSTVTFTLAPDFAYIATVTGTCGGTMTGNSYTTLPIVEDCTVIANFSINNYYVTASAGASGSVGPVSQLISEGAPATVTITPNIGYKIASVAGTCGGTVAGNTFITAPVMGNCTVEATFSIKTSTVTASVSGGNGTVNPASSTVNYGGTAVVTITPDPGHHLATLTDNGVIKDVSGGSYTLTNVTDGHTIIATFAIDTKAITTSVASGNGTITPSSNVNVASSATLTMVPAIGYHLTKVTDNGNDVTSHVNSGSYTINAVSTDHVVMAYFAIDTKSVSATVSGNGTIVPGISSVNYGSNLTLAVTPAPNHRLVTLMDNGFDVTASVSGVSYTITGVTTDHSVTATFALQTKEVTATVSGGNGSITPASSTVNYGGNATLSIAAAPNYHLAKLTDNGADVTVSVIGGSYTITGISESHNVIATFAIDTRNVTAVLSGSGKGTITPASSVVNYGGSATFALTPATGYRLYLLTDNGVDVTGSVSNGGYTIAAITDNHAVVATFRGITFTVTPTAGANGGITPATVQTVDAGQSTAFTVKPNDGYQIASVTGCGVALSGDTYTTAVINGNCSVSATFVAVPALRGDLDGNKKIDVADALMALQFAVGLRARTAADLAAGDVAPIVGGKSAPDGRLDVADAFVLLRRSVDDTFTW